LNPDLINTIDLNPSGGSTVDTTAGYAVVEGKLFFSAVDTAYGKELRWLDVPAASSDPNTPIVIQNTPAVTLIHTIDIHNGSAGSAAGEGTFSGFQPVGNYLYFMANDGVTGDEMHWVDASLATPSDHVINLAIGSTPSNPGGNSSGLIVKDHKLFFNAYATTIGNALYWIDTDVDPSAWHGVYTDSSFNVLGSSGYQSGFALLGDYLFFDVDTDASLSKGIELGYIDTTASTYHISVIDLNTSGSSRPGNYGGFASIGTNLYFYAYDQNAAGYRLKELDFSVPSNPTIRTFDASPDGTAYPQVGHNALKTDGNLIFLNGTVGASGNELVWFDTTDTSDTGPIYGGSPVPHVIDINTNPGGSSNPGKFGNFVIAGGSLYFPVETASNGLELGRVSIVPRVETIVFGDGTDQRSMVKSITVSFNQAVTIDLNAFVLQHRVGTTLTSFSASDLTITVATTTVNGKTEATLTFSGTLIIGDSLFDGNWQLTVLADHVHAGGKTLDGNGDGTAGDNYVKGANAADNFFRLFGDTSGNRNVNVLEFNQFRLTNGLSSSSPSYDARFDFQSNNSVNVLDFNAFRTRYGTTLPG
jgi:hypothetical protein